MQITDLPFIQHIDLQIDQNGDGDIVFLKQQGCLLNHVGSLHASVIHALAESASGHYLILNLLPLFPNSAVLVKSASIQYKRPALQECSAKAEVDPASLLNCIDTLHRRGRYIFTIPVKVFSGDKTIATANIDWWLQTPKS